MCSKSKWAEKMQAVVEKAEDVFPVLTEKGRGNPGAHTDKDVGKVHRNGHDFICGAGCLSVSKVMSPYGESGSCIMASWQAL